MRLASVNSRSENFEKSDVDMAGARNKLPELERVQDRARRNDSAGYRSKSFFDNLTEDTMATSTAMLASLSADEQRRQLRRAVVASTVGTTIEWYDFFLYSTVTGLVFAKLYFPNSDPLVGTLQAFAIYAVGFLARPVGAAIFGHYGDRIGRKSTLIATLLVMGLATFAVAFVPTYATIGIWGSFLLTLLRF